MKTLREIRQQSGLSAKDFADEFEVSESTVYMWERGERTPPLKMALRISRRFDVEVGEILFGAGRTSSVSTA